MRTVSLDAVRDTVRKLYIDACYRLNDDMRKALKEATKTEVNPQGKEILQMISDNADVAEKEWLPICQDTGLAVVYIELGEEVRFDRPGLKEAINQGVSQACKEGLLRASVAKDPLRRGNTGDNTPAIIHLDIVPGDKMKITVGAKGTGSENMSRMKLLTPSAGMDGVKNFVLETVTQGGSNPCPPLVVGVGIGGNLETVAEIAKKSLYRLLNEKNKDPYYAKLEEDWLKEINKTGVGPEGLGGSTTALAVHIEALPCHIGALPVAVNLDCHAHRHKEAVL